MAFINLSLAEPLASMVHSGLVRAIRVPLPHQPKDIVADLLQPRPRLGPGAPIAMTLPEGYAMGNCHTIKGIADDGGRHPTLWQFYQSIYRPAFETPDNTRQWVKLFEVGNMYGNPGDWFYLHGDPFVIKAVYLAPLCQKAYKPNGVPEPQVPDHHWDMVFNEDGVRLADNPITFVLEVGKARSKDDGTIHVFRRSSVLGNTQPMPADHNHDDEEV